MGGTKEKNIYHELGPARQIRRSAETGVRAIVHPSCRKLAVIQSDVAKYANPALATVDANQNISNDDDMWLFDTTNV